MPAERKRELFMATIIALLRSDEHFRFNQMPDTGLTIIPLGPTAFETTSKSLNIEANLIQEIWAEIFVKVDPILIEEWAQFSLFQASREFQFPKSFEYRAIVVHPHQITLIWDGYNQNLVENLLEGTKLNHD